ncbi:hypothetical protein O181_012984 [Austropuccinia psidii MF-1]|uniref:Reverse transcriptase domain-containing protein n=1 Tax=Austropuccinia psidii MF-1 TaxID=1389203 RepID=A0A9Q3BXB8_9BASI|nr:hypothetical protein [Austropuccinia psidii MF-1]
MTFPPLSTVLLLLVNLIHLSFLLLSISLPSFTLIHYFHKEIKDAGEHVAISLLHLFQGDMDLPPLSFHASLEEQWDKEEEPEEIEAVLQVVPPAYHQYLDAFSKVKEEKLPPHHACDHHIKLQGLLPPVDVIYSLSKNESETLWAYISENLEKGFIRPSSSSTGAPILFVRKKDGGLPLCVYYHKIKAFTRKNRYAVPPMDQLLTLFNGSAIFSKIDLRGAYNLLRIKEGDEHSIAFRAKYGSYEYLVMPFGLTNAPASFQSIVNDIFADFLDIFVVVYLDDIIVFPNFEEEHVKHVASLLQRLRDKNLFSKASKCVFHASSVESLGYVVSKEGPKMDSSKEAVSQFQILEEAFTTAPILSHLNPSLPTIVETDCSDYAFGTVLRQVNDSGKHPIAFDSCKLLLTELNYEIHEKEPLGIVCALKCWRAFLLSLSDSFEVLKDHSSLQYFMSSKVLTCHQARWAEFLSDFHFSITYPPGILATLPDALSRCDNVYPERKVDFTSKNSQSFHQVLKQNEIKQSRFFSIKVEVFSDLVDQIQKAVWQDQYSKEILKQFARGELVSDYTLEPQAKFLFFKDRVVIPSNHELQLDILQKCHDPPLAGHPGHKMTLKLIKRDFYFAGINQIVKDYLSSFQQCWRNKNIHHKKLGFLKALEITSGTWNSLSIDFIAQLPLSRNFDSILVAADRFSKMAIFIPTYSTITAWDLTQIFISHVFSKHSLPISIQLRISRDLSTAFHPETHGQTERANQILEQYLWMYVSYHQDDWHIWLPLAEFAYNNAEHSSTKQEPFFTIYRRNPSFDSIHIS